MARKRDGGSARRPRGARKSAPRRADKRGGENGEQRLTEDQRVRLRDLRASIETQIARAIECVESSASLGPVEAALASVIADLVRLASEQESARTSVEQLLKELRSFAAGKAKPRPDPLAAQLMRSWLKFSFGMPLDMVSKIANPVDYLRHNMTRQGAAEQRELELAAAEAAENRGLQAHRDRLMKIRKHLVQGNPTHVEIDHCRLEGKDLGLVATIKSRALDLWQERGQGLASLEQDLLGNSVLQELLLEVAQGDIGHDECMVSMSRTHNPTHRAHLVARALERVDLLLMSVDALLSIGAE